LQALYFKDGMLQKPEEGEAGSAKPTPDGARIGGRWICEPQ